MRHRWKAVVDHKEDLQSHFQSKWQIHTPHDFIKLPHFYPPQTALLLLKKLV